MSVCVDAVIEGFAEPSDERLDHLGPGCFVQKMEVCGTCCWVELTEGDEGIYEGIAHPALSDNEAALLYQEGDRVQVTRDQITALGCDRYCFC